MGWYQRRVHGIIILNILNFYLLILISIILALRITSDLLLWIRLELNILRFLPIMSSKENIEIENSIKYFLIQRWASVIFLMRFFFFYIINNAFYILINLSLFIKLGIRPFHSWFISILKTSSLNILFIVIFLTLFFILILLPRTLSINKVLAISSINNVISLKIIFIYLRIYIYLLIGFINIYKFYGLNIFTQINSIIFFDKFIMLIIFISLGGIPPLLGFLGKIIILKILLNNFIRITIIFAIIASSLLLLYFYLSRIYFYLTNIPSLKINFKLRLLSIKKIIYFTSLVYFNLFFIVYI